MLLGRLRHLCWKCASILVQKVTPWRRNSVQEKAIKLVTLYFPILYCYSMSAWMCMCMCVYLCMCVWMYVHVCVCIHVQVYWCCCCPVSQLILFLWLFPCFSSLVMGPNGEMSRKGIQYCPFDSPSHLHYINLQTSFSKVSWMCMQDYLLQPHKHLVRRVVHFAISKHILTNVAWNIQTSEQNENVQGSTREIQFFFMLMMMALVTMRQHHSFKSMFFKQWPTNPT